MTFKVILFFVLCVFGGCYTVDEVNYVLEWDATVGCEADFASARVGVTCSDSVTFDLRTEFAESPFVDFGMSETFVACKSATANFLRYNYRGRAHFGKAD